MLERWQLSSYTASTPLAPGCQRLHWFTVGTWLLALLAVLAGLAYVVRKRGQIRQAFSIPGSTCTDCLAWSFCAPCALCQEVRMQRSTQQMLAVRQFLVVGTR